MRPVGYGPAARPARVFVDGREPSGEHVRSFRNSCLEFRTGVGQRRGERKKKWDACRLGMARPKVWEQRWREGRGGRKERRGIKRRWKDKGRGFWARSVAGWKREREGWKNASEPRYGLTGAPVLQRRCTSRISERPDSSWDIQRTEYPDRLYDFPFCHGCPPPPSTAVSTFSLFSTSFVPFRFYFFLHIFPILSLHLWHIDGIRYSRNFTWEFHSWHFGRGWIRKRNWFIKKGKWVAGIRLPCHRDQPVCYRANVALNIPIDIIGSLDVLNSSHHLPDIPVSSTAGHADEGETNYVYSTHS